MHPPRRDRRLTLGIPSSLVGRVEPPRTNGAASAGAEGRATRYIAEVRRILGRFGVRRHVPKGASLFSVGDTGRHLYIVESGRIDASLPDDPGGYAIASFHPGASFMFDLDGCYLAVCTAAEDSAVINLPYHRLRKLSQQGMELRLLLRQCNAFDLKSFLDLCYPAAGRFRLVHPPGRERAAESGDTERGPQNAPPLRHSPHSCAAPGGPPRRRRRRARSHDQPPSNPDSGGAPREGEE